MTWGAFKKWMKKNKIKDGTHIHYIYLSPRDGKPWVEVYRGRIKVGTIRRGGD